MKRDDRRVRSFASKWQELCGVKRVIPQSREESRYLCADVSGKLGFISLLTLRWVYAPGFPPRIHPLLGQKPHILASRFPVKVSDAHSLCLVNPPIWSARSNKLTPMVVLTQNRPLSNTLKKTQSQHSGVRHRQTESVSPKVELAGFCYSLPTVSQKN